MPVATIADFVVALQSLPLLTADQKAQLSALQQQYPDLQALAEALIRKGWLTSFQANQLVRGKEGELVLGPYVLLDCLGEGGAGKVFKARHRTSGQVVALKVLHAGLVADPEIRGRFFREIKVSSQLPPHPNLIAAVDSGEIGKTHYLAMEYIDGTDLAKMAEQSGRLPVERACEWIRQAATGLQHAHRHGLVHRDIKPSNLIVTGESASSPGTVKILDLGLARLQTEKSARDNSFHTSDGTGTFGTIDYQAPEQALDFHRADIRADIYSLGCTLFYLLTGRPPFIGGPMAVRLMQHQRAKPPDLKACRPDVPDGLMPILERMLAKKPADRYRTPGDVAAALDQLLHPRRSRKPLVLGIAAAASAGLVALLLLVLVLIGLARRPHDAASSTVKPPAAELKSVVQPPPPPPSGSVEALVPEAREYELVYDLNLAKLSKNIAYDEDRHAKITKPFDRIAYCIELTRKEGESQYLYVSMAAFTTDVKKIGVPTIASGASFQMNVAEMNVYSNVSGIVTGTGLTGGNIEFWPNNYGPQNAVKVPGADSQKFDFGDQMTGPHDGYGSMQVHNHAARQTLFAVNHWGAGGKADIGIGNSPNGNPDWTFTGSAGNYRAKRLRVLVRYK